MYKMYQSSNQIKSSDLLNLRQQKGFGCLLHSHEEIILSSRILKLNREGKCQERILVLTNQAILNIAKNSSIIKAFMKKFVHFEDKYDLRRRIPLIQLYGITMTPNRSSDSFLLHVANDHDYYYKADHNKMLLLEAISQQYQVQTKKPLPFFFKEEKQLLNYCTFKNHLKEKKDLKPKENPRFLDHEYFKDREFDDTEYFSECFEQSQKNMKIQPKQFFRVNIHQLKPQNRYFVLREQQNRSINVASLNKFPNVLKPSFCFFNEAKELLFTPFMPGGPLKHYIHKYLPLPREALLFYLWQMILILERFEWQKKMYPEFTLDNIFVKQNGYLMLNGLQKLIDVKEKEQDKLVFRIEGNPYYFSPQVITFEGYSSELSVWKLGICAYYLYRGRYPFQGKNIKELYYNILTQDIEEEDADLPNFIVKMLEKDKKKRITLEELKKHSQIQAYNWKALDFEKIKTPFPINHTSWTVKMPVIYQLRVETEDKTVQKNENQRKGSLGLAGCTG